PARAPAGAASEGGESRKEKKTRPSFGWGGRAANPKTRFPGQQRARARLPPSLPPSPGAPPMGCSRPRRPAPPAPLFRLASSSLICIAPQQPRYPRPVQQAAHDPPDRPGADDGDIAVDRVVPAEMDRADENHRAEG